MTGEARRDWLKVGRGYTGPEHRPAVEAAIASLEWQRTRFVTGPFERLAALQSILTSFDIPRVRACAIGPGVTYGPGVTFPLLGVQADFVNGRGWLYALEAGEVVVPILSEFRPYGVSRADHVDWAKVRALMCLENVGMPDALEVLCSDLRKHPETADHPAILECMMLAAQGKLDDPADVQDYIDAIR